MSETDPIERCQDALERCEEILSTLINAFSEDLKQASPKEIKSLATLSEDLREEADDDMENGDCKECEGAEMAGRKCDICGQQMRKQSHTHHLEVSPLDLDRCLGCWVAATQLELFLVRANGESHLGDWAAGWLREVIKEPWRYLDPPIRKRP